jgi:hypothetical protein
MGMELCCLYLGLLWVRESFGLGYIAFTVILAIYPATLFLRLLLTKSSLIPGGGQLHIILIGTAVTALVAGLAIWEGSASQPAVGQQDARGLGFQICFLAITWWLGFSLARGGINYRYICFRFQLGILALLVLSMLTGQVFLPVVLFFTLAVFALVLARWENSVAISRATLKSLPFGKIILSSMVILLPVTGLFFILSHGVAETIVGWISGIGDSIDGFFKSGLISDAGQANHFQPSCSMWVPEEAGLIPEATPPDTPAVWRPVYSWLILLLTGLSILAIILLTIRKRKSRRHLTQPETSTDFETTKVSASLLSELAAFFKRVGKWLWQAMLALLRRRSDTAAVTAYGGDPGLSVRALYRHLLDWAAKRGLPREQTQTPLEYLKALCQKFPEKDKELAFITDVYVQVRYGHRPVSDAEAEAIGQAWQAIALSP